MHSECALCQLRCSANKIWMLKKYRETWTWVSPKKKLCLEDGSRIWLTIWRFQNPKIHRLMDQIWGCISGWLFLSLPCKWSLLSQEQYCQRRGLVHSWAKKGFNRQCLRYVGVRFRWSCVETAQFTMLAFFWSSTWRFSSALSSWKVWMVSCQVQNDAPPNNDWEWSLARAILSEINLPTHNWRAFQKWRPLLRILS